MLAGTLALGCLAATTQQLYTPAEETFSVASADNFGLAVALGDDVLAVGSDESPQDTVYVYERAGPQAPWTLAARLEEPGSATFGTLVALSGDTLAALVVDGFVSTGFESSVHLYERDTGGAGAWGFTMVLTPDTKIPGVLSSLAIDGDRLVIGSLFDWEVSPTGPGWVMVFDRGIEGVWRPVARLTASDGTASDWFGDSVALAGDRVLVGAPQVGVSTTGFAHGAAYVFERSGGSWQEFAKLVPGGTQAGQRVGRAVALQGDDAFLGGQPFSTTEGSAHVFTRDAFRSWIEVAALDVPGTGLLHGAHLAVFGDTLVAAGSSLFMPTTVFARDQGGPGAWGAVAQFQAPRGFQSASASADGILLGAPFEFGAGRAEGFARDALTGTLYATDETGRLYGLDAITGLATPIGNGTGFADIQALAWDPGTGMLYAADDATNRLIRVDPVTGLGVAVGALAGEHLWGLSFDSTGGALYGLREGTAGAVKLVVIDPATGSSTAIGSTGVDSLRGLALDPIGGRLFAADSSLYELDPATGAATLVGPVGQPSLGGLVHDGAGLLAVDGGYPSSLVSLDPATGAGLQIGPLASTSVGVVRLFETPPASTTYCTAGVSLSGCQAAIGTLGSASATLTSGFALHAGGVEGGADGLFFFGANGRQAVTWGNGTSLQCVQPPVSRTPLLTSSGIVGSCDGTFYLDLNALWCPTCPKPNHNPGAGAVVQAQLWYRDPWNTSNQTTSLSDAIEFQVTP